MDELRLQTVLEFKERKSQSEHKLSAASGIVQKDDRFYIVCDDENSLAHFEFKTESNAEVTQPEVKWVSLFSEKLPEEYKTRKKEKADLEILVLIEASQQWPQGGLICLPSGSKPNRSRGVLLQFKSEEQVAVQKIINLAPLYLHLAESNFDLNLEGCLIFNEKMFLFHRGNQTFPENRVYELDAPMFLNQATTAGEIDASVFVKESKIEIGELDGVPLGITDACQLDEKHFLILSAAEKTDNAYDDGAVLGSVMSLFRLDFSLVKQFALKPVIKAEGLTFDSKSNAIYVVADPDHRNKLTTLYRANLSEFLE